MKRTTWWRRWRSRFVGGALLLAGAGGCKQQVFLEPGDWAASLRPGIPANLETNVQDPIVPGSDQVRATPATVRDFGRQQRPLSLKEAFATAVEQGNIGSQGLTGQDNLLLPSFAGNGLSGSDTIKAFLYDPAVAQASIEQLLSRFDVIYRSSLQWAKQDQATLSLQQSFSNGDSAQFQNALAKQLPTGGLVGITTNIAYQKLASPPTQGNFVTLNTSYSPSVTVSFEQPLMRGFGIEANQLLASHPMANGNQLGLQGTGNSRTGEGILVTRLRAEQTRQQFDVYVNQMLLNVETAYWNLYSAYYNLDAQQKGLAQALTGYQYYLARWKARDPADPPGKQGIDPPYLLPQAEAQYHTFKLQVLQARSDLLNAERNLRGLLGMKSDDGTVFVPTDEPTRTPNRKDFGLLWQEAIRQRPELLIARQEVKAQQLNVMAQKIQRRPDVRAFGNYSMNGLGGRLAGPQFDEQGRPNNALASLASNDFTGWTVGVNAQFVLGYREANALVRAQQLNLRRAWMQLSDAERKAYEFLADSYRQLEFALERIEVARTNKLALQEQVARFEGRVEGGINTSGEFINLTQAQRDLAQRTSDEFKAVADYNTALARIEFAKGTMQQYAGVAVADGPLPPHVQKKAADHFRACAAALKLREHPAATSGLLQTTNLNAPIPPFPYGAVPGTPPAAAYPLTPPLPAPPLPAPPAGNGKPDDKKPEDDKTGTGKPLTAGSPAPTTVRPYADWQATNPGTGVPSSLPTLGTVKSPADEFPGNPVFAPIKDVTLPTRTIQTGPQPPK